MKLALWHLLFWLVPAVIVITSMVRWGGGSAVPYWITAYIFYISAFYVNLFLILSRWVRKRKFFALLIRWLGLVAAYTAGILLLNKAFGVYQVGTEFSKMINWLLRTSTYLAGLIFLSFAYRFAMDWFRNDRIRLEMEKNALKLELGFLQGQLNPHFLFNTLNNIYILAYKQSTQTAEAILRMSEIVRYMLYESGEALVPLTKEIYYIRQMMELQRLRMPGSMFFDFSVAGEAGDYQIAPMLLISLAENMFKHAILNDCDNPAVMHLEIGDKRLFLSCSNKINNSLKDKAGGIGLVNLKRRMELLYPGRHNFQVHSDGTFYKTLLTIQFN